MMEDRRVHNQKAWVPMLLTELGIVMDVKPLQYWKAEPVIPIVPSFSTMLVLVGMVPLYVYATLPAYTTPLG